MFGQQGMGLAMGFGIGVGMGMGHGNIGSPVIPMPYMGWPQYPGSLPMGWPPQAYAQVPTAQQQHLHSQRHSSSSPRGHRQRIITTRAQYLRHYNADLLQQLVG